MTISGSIFGEKALIAEDLRQASCIANTPVKVLALGREDFVALLGSVSELGGKAQKPQTEDPMFAKVNFSAPHHPALMHILDCALLHACACSHPLKRPHEHIQSQAEGTADGAATSIKMDDLIVLRYQI